MRYSVGRCLARVAGEAHRRNYNRCSDTFAHPRFPPSFPSSHIPTPLTSPLNLPSTAAIPSPSTLASVPAAPRQLSFAKSASWPIFVNSRFSASNMDVIVGQPADALANASARVYDATAVSSASARAAAAVVDKSLFHTSSAASVAEPAPPTSSAAFSAEGGNGGEEKKEPAGTAVPKRHRARVYTRTGDKGTSSLYTGERRRKDDCVFQALGDVDELNSALALAAEYSRLQGMSGLWDQIAVIQSRLLDVGSAVATPPASASAFKLRRVRFDPTAVATLEQWIDSMDEKLPALTLFILPSGGLASAHLHLARSICRRAERAVIGVVREDEEQQAKEEGEEKGEEVVKENEEEGEVEVEGRPPRIEQSVLKYLNRLSDYLFTAARFAAQHAGREETVYKKATPEA